MKYIVCSISILLAVKGYCQQNTPLNFVEDQVRVLNYALRENISKISFVVKKIDQKPISYSFFLKRIEYNKYEWKTTSGDGKNQYERIVLTFKGKMLVSLYDSLGAIEPNGNKTNSSISLHYFSDVDTGEEKYMEYGTVLAFTSLLEDGYGNPPKLCRKKGEIDTAEYYVPISYSHSSHSVGEINRRYFSLCSVAIDSTFFLSADDRYYTGGVTKVRRVGKKIIKKTNYIDDNPNPIYIQYHFLNSANKIYKSVFIDPSDCYSEKCPSSYTELRYK